MHIDSVTVIWDLRFNTGFERVEEKYILAKLSLLFSILLLLIAGLLSPARGQRPPAFFGLPSPVFDRKQPEAAIQPLHHGNSLESTVSVQLFYGTSECLCSQIK